jgi:nitrogen regulatory protein PII
VKANPTQYDTPIAPRKLKLLVTVVNREKAEFYTDLLQSFEVNFQTAMNARGTASKETLRLLGIGETDKTVIFSVIREDMCDKALSALEQKFKTIKNGKGIAYTIPMTGTIGVAIYRFLSNTPA